MKAGAYFILLFVAATCVGLSVALVAVATSTQRLQVRLQAQQQTLDGGILGQQGRQISAGVLQDMAGVAAKNPRLRNLLDKYGYRVSAPAATNVTQETATEPEAL